MSLDVKIYSSEVELIVEDSGNRKFKLKGFIVGKIDGETRYIEGFLKDAKLVDIDLTYPRKVKQAISILEELL